MTRRTFHDPSEAHAEVARFLGREPLDGQPFRLIRRMSGNLWLVEFTAQTWPARVTRLYAASSEQIFEEAA